MPTVLRLFILFLVVIVSPIYASVRPAITQPIPITELTDYSQYPIIVKQLINEALLLTQKNLTYLYGSADPKNRGMDCSGTIYYLLKQNAQENVPRSAEEMYQWVKQKGRFYEVTDKSFTSPQFNHLKPGDLLFWRGTYKTAHNQVSHVMLYLGKNQQGKPLMFGSSDGRTYQGKSMWGVSVFDFKLPNVDSSAQFIGYSCIPELTCNLPAGD